jgi:hypothetical protein
MRGIYLFILTITFGVAEAATLTCDLDSSTPSYLSEHIPRAMYSISITISKGNIKDFSNEKILNVETSPTRYGINFKDGGSAYLDRESLDLIYFPKEMMGATGEDGIPLAMTYGNSRDPGADYKCRKDSPKI